MKSIINQQPLKECGNIGRQSFLSYVCSSLLLLVQSDTNLWYAYRGWIAGLISSATVAYREVITNNRLLVGVVLMFGVAPLCYMAPYFSFLWSPDAVEITGFYYKKIAYYVFTVHWTLVIFFFSTGVFISFPTQSPKFDFKFAIPPFIWFSLAEVIHQTFYIDKPNDFFKFPVWMICVACVVTLYSVKRFGDYIVWRKYHRSDSFPLRMDGICLIADTNDPIQAAFVKTWNEMKAKNF